jgi:hypothetical protein
MKFKGSNTHGPILGQYFQMVTEGEVKLGDDVYAYP